MIVCPKCKAQSKYYFDGMYIRCNSCGHTEWKKKDVNLWKKWNKEGELRRSE